MSKTFCRVSYSVYCCLIERKIYTYPEHTPYTMCVLERLQDSLRRRDVCVSQSDRWGDPRAKLLHGAKWEALRVPVCQTLGRHPTAAAELRRLEGQLDTAYRRTATNFPANAAVSIAQQGGRDTLTVTGRINRKNRST